MASSGEDISKLYKELQQIASDTQIKLQQMTDVSTAKSFEFNSKEALKSRNWQTSMSNTAHQREVRDLKAAGLNPVLSANNGAQSYTTSSASAEADNAASAVGQLTASRMSSMANIGSSKIGADATKQAAATNAAAMKAASAQAAAAQRYSADAARYAAAMNYQAQVDTARINQETSKYQVDNQLPRDLYGYLYKMAERAGINNDIAKGIGQLWTGVKGKAAEAVNKGIYDLKHQSINKQLNDPNRYMNRTVSKLAEESLKKMELKVNAETKLIFIKAAICHEEAAQKMFYRLLAEKKAKKVRDAVRNFSLSF